MPARPVQLGCVDCHGGNAKVNLAAGLAKGSKEYTKTLESAHVLPRYPANWHYPKSANPERTYTLLNQEAPEFIRFTNPSDYRVVRQACGACHAETIEASLRSMHTTGAMLWGGASYNNGILDYKNYILGESYNEKGEAVVIKGPAIPADKQPRRAAGILPQLAPLPAWETVYPSDIFRVFERGGRNIKQHLPRDRHPEQPWTAAENRGAGSSGLPAEQPRTGHRLAHRRAADQHHQDAPERSAHLVHGHQRPARRLPGIPAARPAMWCMRMTATRSIRASMRSSATRARRRPSTRPSRGMNPAIR